MSTTDHPAQPRSEEDGMSESNVPQSPGGIGTGQASQTSPPSVPKPGSVASGCWKHAPNSDCYASFGDQGTTATVSAFGQLVQFSDFIGAGNSGMFSVDHEGVDDPYQVSRRAWELHHRSRQPSHFGLRPSSDPPYGLRFPGLFLEDSTRPQLTWTNWRWPCHEYDRGAFRYHPNLKLTIQWIVQEKTVLQRCILDNEGKELELDVEFVKPTTISDLDHLTPHCKFNEGKGGHHHALPGPKGHTWVYVRKFPQAKNDLGGAGSCPVTAPDDNSASHLQGPSDGPRNETSPTQAQDSPDQDSEAGQPHGVSVACSVAINGVFQSFDNDKSTQTWPLPSQARRMGEPNGQAKTIEVITAYKMSLVANLTSWQNRITPLHLDIVKVIRPVANQKPADPFAPHDLAPLGDSLSATVGTPGPSSPVRIPGFPKSHLDFAIRRNLEHILSVCAVQATATEHGTTATSALPRAVRDAQAVALTCGDISGHRICWSASFFAFRFLTEFYSAHSKEEPRDYDLLGRIEAVCLGHLKWLHLVQPQESGQRFGANYWVTGKPVTKPKGSESWKSEASYLDTGFQILKAAACMELFDDGALAFGGAAELMSEWAPFWLISLENADKRKKYAWPQAEKEGVDSFRLDEHVWLWQALTSLARNGDQAWKSMPIKCGDLKLTVPAGREDWEEEIERLRTVFSPETVRREVSRRFTTENTILRKRMLATTRSIRESRFMLHARDTAILYEAPFHFLGKDSSINELLEATIQSQMHHAEEPESNMEKTLRYALYLMLGTRRPTINEKTADELVGTATTTLIRASSPNGLFPGRIELSTKEPVDSSEIEEEDLESYYHASFEIPYILFAQQKGVSEAYGRLEPPASYRRNSMSTPTAQAAQKESKPRLAPAPFNTSLGQGDSEQRQMLFDIRDLLLSGSTAPGPDNRQISLGIRRKVAKAVPFDKLVDSSNIVRLEDEWLYKYPDFLSRGETLKIPSDEEGLADMKRVLGLSKAEKGLRDLNEDTEQDLRYWIVDWQSSKRVSRKRKQHEPKYYVKFDELQKTLREPRIAKNSKKRLLHFEMVSSQVALHCFATTEESERPYLKDFFERHSLSRKHPIDNCSMIQNSWDSEFHLSYYQLIPESSYSSNGITAKPEIDKFPGRPKMLIVRVAAGFRFNGDFFDRHWTCYMLDSTQKDPITNPELLRDREYCQRKVLEQQYFADILKSLNASVGEILEKVKSSLGVKSGSFPTSLQTTNEYLSWSELWKGFQPLLQKLNDDLAVTQSVVKQWDAREEERGKEKPRWTPNDERKYRAAIARIHRDVKRQMGQLRYLHETTSSLQVLCSNRLDKARENLQFRSDQNIAMFTYVTVVFLPLGFAASILSMNGPPDKSLTITVVIASAVALAATIVALMNAKALASVAESAAKKFEDFTVKVRRSSAMICDSEDPGDENMDNDETSDSDHSNIKPLRGPPPSYLIFWAGYIFIEVPARTITSACRALGSQAAGENESGSKDTERVSASVPKAQNGRAHPGLPNYTNNSHPVNSHPANSHPTNSLPVNSHSHSVNSHPINPHPINPHPVNSHGIDGPATKTATKTAQSSEAPPGDVNKGIKTLAGVIMGFLTLPLFVGTWILQILLLNAWDALALLGGLIGWLSHSFLFTEIKSDSHILSNLTRPPKFLRPLNMLKTGLQRKQDPASKGASKTTLEPKEDRASKGDSTKSATTTEVPSSAANSHRSP